MLQKTCKKHGVLTEENIILEKSKINKSGILLRCWFCKSEKDKRNYDKNQKKRIEYSIKWKKDNHEHHREWGKNDRKNNPQKYRDWTNERRKKIGSSTRMDQEISRNFGLSIEQYKKIIDEYNNLCAICGKPETRKGRTPGTTCRLVMDHCHYCEEKHGKGLHTIRGILCHACNQVIGHGNDSIEILKKAIEYLLKHEHAKGLADHE